jgi:hypothetical protein
MGWIAISGITLALVEAKLLAGAVMILGQWRPGSVILFTGPDAFFLPEI